MIITIHWPLVLFTVCAAWAAGLFAVQGIWGIRAITPKTQTVALIVSLFAAAVTAIMGVNASDGWKDLFGGQNNIISGMDLVTAALVAFFVVGIIYFICLAKCKGNVPLVASILAILVSVALLLAVFRFYSLAQGTAWDSPLWTLVILGNAAALGAGTFCAIAANRRESIKNLNDSIVLPAAGFNMLASLLFLGVLTATGGARTSDAVLSQLDASAIDPELAAQGDVIGHAILPFDQEIIFVTVVILLGAVLAFVSALLAKKNNTWFVGCWMVMALTLLGAFAMNFVIYMVVISGTMF